MPVNEMRAITKSIMGKELSKEERAAVKTSDNAAVLPKQFINELEEIKKGYGSLKEYCDVKKVTKNEGSIKELINGFEIILEIPYDKQKDLENLLSCQYSKEYSLSVIYKIKCNKELKENLEKLYSLKQIKETKIVIV